VRKKGVSGDDDNKKEVRKRNETYENEEETRFDGWNTKLRELELTQNCQDSALGQAKRNLLLVNDGLMNIDQSGSIGIWNISVLSTAEKGDRLRESPNKGRNDDRLVSALETPLHGMTVDGTVTSAPVVLISEGRPKRVEVQYKY
jgi:hypothetical protein